MLTLIQIVIESSESPLLGCLFGDLHTSKNRLSSLSLFRVPIDSNFDSLSTGAANLHVNVSLKLTDEIYRHEMSQKDSQMFKDKSSLLMSQVGMTCESAFINNQRIMLKSKQK